MTETRIDANGTKWTKMGESTGLTDVKNQSGRIRAFYTDYWLSMPLVEGEKAASDKATQVPFTCFKCGDGRTPLYCLNCATDILQSDLTAAKAEVAALQQDKERLDWLETHKEITIMRGRNGVWLHRITPHGENPSSLRAAIDAARKGEK